MQWKDYSRDMVSNGSFTSHQCEGNEDCGDCALIRSCDRRRGSKDILGQCGNSVLHSKLGLKLLESTSEYCRRNSRPPIPSVDLYRDKTSEGSSECSRGCPVSQRSSSIGTGDSLNRVRSDMRGSGMVSSDRSDGHPAELEMSKFLLPVPSSSSCRDGSLPTESPTLGESVCFSSFQHDFEGFPSSE